MNGQKTFNIGPSHAFLSLPVISARKRSGFGPLRTYIFYMFYLQQQPAVRADV